MVADVLAGRIGSGFKRDRSRTQTATGRLADRPVLAAKPMNFMNVSGPPIAALAAFYKVPPERIVVLHDELDLPFGAVRLKLGGGDNGHNGLRSVTRALGTLEYYRVRIGIGRPVGRQDPADFVLTNFGPAERKELPLTIELAAGAVEALLRSGLAAAQNEIHTLGPPPR
jgi:PTH1 family peptidyl-tRNA hydrolase